MKLKVVEETSDKENKQMIKKKDSSDDVPCSYCNQLYFW